MIRNDNTTNRHLEILQRCRKLETMNPKATEEIIFNLKVLENVFAKRAKRAAEQEARSDLHNVFAFPGGHCRG